MYPVPDQRWRTIRYAPSGEGISIYINDGPKGPRLGVNGFHSSHDKMALLSWAEAELGITWEPPKKLKVPRLDPISFAVRNQFFGETYRVLKWRMANGEPIALDQFRLLINDFMPVDAQRREWAYTYGLEFRMDLDVIADTIANYSHKNYKADQRAQILGVTYGREAAPCPSPHRLYRRRWGWPREKAARPI
jgi:hypothetical protein